MPWPVPSEICGPSLLRAPKAAHRFSDSGLRQHATRLLGLNTALLSYASENKGKLQLGVESLMGAWKKKPVAQNELVIALSHHSPAWLLDEDEVLKWMK